MKRKIESKPTVRFQPSRLLLKSYIYILMFVYGMAVLIISLILADVKFLSPKQLELLNKFPHYTFELLIVISIVNIYFLLTLLRNKRWGFWGYCISGGIGTVALNLYMGQTLAQAILGITGVMLLFLFLRLGGKHAVWNELN